MESKYGEFAYLYDRLMEEFDYKSWALYYQELMNLSGIKTTDPLNICDAACGTASMTLELSKLGHKLTGIDNSADMLRAAAEKARCRGVNIPFIKQDMRSLALHRPVNAVICACDGVNYLLTDDDVRDFFIAANRSLLPGGGLFFDISSEYKLSEYIGNQFFGEEREDIVYLWQNLYNAQKSLLKMNITFFVRQEGQIYKRFDEVHVQRAHNADNIRRILSECGFTVTGVFGGQTLEPPSVDDLRIHFAAIKVMSYNNTGDVK